MKKRLTGLALALALCLSLLPTAVFAETQTPDNTDVTSSGVVITGTADGSWTTKTTWYGEDLNGTVEYDIDSNTLTLNNAYISTTATAGIDVAITYSGSAPLTIVLKGDNTLFGNNYAIRLTNTNSLTIQCASGSSGTLSLSSGDKVLGDEDTPIALTVKDGAKVTVTQGALNLSSLNVSGEGSSFAMQGSSEIEYTRTKLSAVPTVTGGGQIVVGSYDELLIGGDKSSLTADSLSGLVNNGMVWFTFANLTPAEVKALKIPGTGQITTNNITYTNTGLKYETDGDGKLPTLDFTNSSTSNKSDDSITAESIKGDSVTSGYLWEGDSTNGYTLTLKNYVAGEIKLPNANVTINIIGDAYINTLSGYNESSGNGGTTITIQKDTGVTSATLTAGNIYAYNASLTLDGITATIESITGGGSSESMLTLGGGTEATVGGISWPDYSANQGTAPGVIREYGIIMKGDSHLTVTSTLGNSAQLFVGYIKMEDDTTITLDGVPINNGGNMPNGLDGLNDFLPDGYEITKKVDDDGGSRYGYTIYKKGDTTNTPVRNLTLQRHYTVTFDANGGTLAAGAKNPVRVARSSTVTKPADPTLTGAAFAGWYEYDKENSTLADNQYDFTAKVTKDLNLQAKWELIYNITVNTPDNNGTVSVKVNDAVATTAKAGDTVTFTVTPNNGYALDTLTVLWGDGISITPELVSGSTYSFTMPSGHVTITATFKQGSSTPTPTKPTPSAPLYPIIVEEAENGEAESNHDYARPGTIITITVSPEEACALTRLKAVDASGNEVKLTHKGGNQYTFIMPASKVVVTPRFRGQQPFTDVKPGDYFFDPVNWALDNGITTGITSTTFAPYAPCTRGQFVTFLWRAIGEPAAKNSVNPFSDVNEKSAFYQAILWAEENGIVTGYSDGTFRPENHVTRQQAAAILFRYARYAGMEALTLQELLSGFADADQVAPYAVTAMNWALGANVMQGSGNYLYPRNTCTRAQVVTMLYRLLAK